MRCSYKFILCFRVFYYDGLGLAFYRAGAATDTTRFYYAERVFDNAFDSRRGTIPLTQRATDTFRFVYMYALYRAVSGCGRYADRGAGFGALTATHALIAYGIIMSAVFFPFFDRAERTDISAISAVYAFFFIDPIRHCRAP